MKINKSETKILIVGLGLMGGSYADAFSRLGYYVGAVDISKESIDFALNKGLISSGKTSPTPDYIKDFDIIIFAVYPHSIINWISENQEYIKENAIITDVTGVKSCFIYKLQSILRPDLEFIGAHPMAGKESSGIKNASSDIFIGANYIITPTNKNTDSAIAAAEEIGRLLGFGSITHQTPEKHDELIGFLSQLTHCIAVSLMTCRDTSSMACYSGDSFRDLTRIANINDEMWSELFLLNKDALLEQMDMFSASFDKLKDYIKCGNKDGIREIMQQSTKERLLFDKVKER